MPSVLEKSGRQLDLGSERLFDAGDARSLDDVVARLSQNLTVRGNAVCLVCGGTLISSGEGKAAAECTACGSALE